MARLNLNELSNEDLAVLGITKNSEADTVTLSKWQFDNLQYRIDRLQEAADKYHIYDLEAIQNSTTLQDVNNLRQEYNTDWFLNCQYSDDIVRKIASALLAASELYYPGNPMWLAASQGDYPTDPGLPPPECKAPDAKPWRKKQQEKNLAEGGQEP